MGQNEGDKNRMGFLEDASGAVQAGDDSSGQQVSTEPLAYYDFNADYIDLPGGFPMDKEGNPAGLQTTGEIKYGYLKRICWILLRIAVAITFIWIFVRGSSCEMPGTIITCT